jgi:hypothetical protein
MSERRRSSHILRCQRCHACGTYSWYELTHMHIVYIFYVRKINRALICGSLADALSAYSRFSRLLDVSFGRGVHPTLYPTCAIQTQTRTLVGTQHMRLPASRTLRRRPRLPHPIFRCVPKDMIVILRNLFSFWLTRATSSEDSLTNGEFSPDIGKPLGQHGWQPQRDSATQTIFYVVLSFLREISL